MIRLANPSFLFIGVIFLALFFKREAAFLGYSQLDLLEGGKGPRFWRHPSRFLMVFVLGLLVLGVGGVEW